MVLIIYSMIYLKPYLWILYQQRIAIEMRDGILSCCKFHELEPNVEECEELMEGWIFI